MKSGESNLNRIVIVQCNFIGGNDVVEGKIVKSFFHRRKNFLRANYRNYCQKAVPGEKITSRGNYGKSFHYHRFMLR